MSLPLTRVLTRGRCSRSLGGSAHLPRAPPSAAAAAVPVAAAAGGAAAARHPPLSSSRRRPASSTTAPAAASPRVTAASTTAQQQQQAAVRPPPAATSVAARLAPPPPPPPAVVTAPPPASKPATPDQQPSSSSLGSLGFPNFRHFDAEYALGEVIGAGASGRVHHATHRASGRRVAVKILPKRRESPAGGGNTTSSSSGGSSSPSSSRGGDDVVAAEASTSSQPPSSSSSPDPCCRAAAIRREVSATSAASAGSPFAARLEAVYESEGDALLVLERCEGGDLRGLLQDRNGAPLDEASAAAVLRGVLHALAACHAQGMVYGDVKPGNVCLLRRRNAEDSSSSSADGDAPTNNNTDLAFFGGVRLVDWGAASPAPLAPGALSGSPLYWAPEQAVGFAAAGAMLAGGGGGGGDNGGSGSGDEDGVIGGAPPQSAARGGYGPAVDVWAAGVLAYQLMSGRLPYWSAASAATEGGGPPRGLRPWQLLAAIRTAPISAWPGASALARDLVVRCMLERDPARRITAAEVLAHPFFAKHGLGGGGCEGEQQQQQQRQSAR